MLLFWSSIAEKHDFTIVILPDLDRKEMEILTESVFTYRMR